MCARVLLAALALGAVPAAGQAPPAGPLPLRPGSVGLAVEGADSFARVTVVLAGSPAATAGIAPGNALLAVDARPVAGWSAARVQTALAGPLGSPVELALAGPRGRRTVRLARADVLAPGPDYTGVAATRRHVVHHRPGEERRARAAARAAERAYARTGLTRDTGGRRAHLYLVGPGQSTGAPVPLPLWAEWVTGDFNVYGPSYNTTGYLAYGDPGRAAEERLAPKLVWPVNAREAHRWAAELPPRMGLSPVRGEATLAKVADVSLREYVRERFGERRFRALWQSDLAFEQAVPRTLGVPVPELERGWRRAITHLGPDPEVRVRPGTVGVALGWGALFLLLGAWAARRREVG